MGGISTAAAQGDKRANPFLQIFGFRRDDLEKRSSSLATAPRQSVANSGQQGARRPANRRASLLNQR